MHENRYCPPTAEVRDATSTEHLPPKPMALTALQALAYLAIAILFVAALGSLLTLLDVRRTQPFPLGIALFNFSALAALIIMQVQLRRRTRTGQVLSVVGVALFTAPIWPVLLDPTLVETSQTKSAPIVYGLLLLALLPFALWAYAVAFSRKAKRYFQAASAAGRQ
jgi:hypothetical protein